jgi:hypothetical protein
MVTQPNPVNVLKYEKFITVQCCGTGIWIWDPVFFYPWIWDPRRVFSGSWLPRISDLGSQTPISGSLVTSFWVKNIFYLYL